MWCTEICACTKTEKNWKWNSLMKEMRQLFQPIALNWTNSMDFWDNFNFLRFLDWKYCTVKYLNRSFSTTSINNGYFKTSTILWIICHCHFFFSVNWRFLHSNGLWSICFRSKNWLKWAFNRKFIKVHHLIYFYSPQYTMWEYANQIISITRHINRFHQIDWKVI